MRKMKLPVLPSTFFTIAKRMATLSAAIIMLSLAAAPASAQRVPVWLDSGRGYGASIDQLFVEACDEEADNLGIRTEYLTADEGRFHVGDGNGSQEGCGLERAEDNSTVVSIRVCAHDPDLGKDIECTPWEDIVR
jgi:hypothetical protein